METTTMILTFLSMVSIIYSICLWYINQKCYFESSRLMSEVSSLRAVNEELKADNKFAHTLLSKTREELADAKNEIWDYQTSEIKPEQKVLMEEMKTYIFHLLRKQSVVMGLNDEDKNWIKRLGGHVEEEDE